MTTWRERIQGAHAAVGEARQQRRTVFMEAHEAGYTYGQIGAAAGITRGAVYSAIAQEKAGAAGAAPAVDLDAPVDG